MPKPPMIAKPFLITWVLARFVVACLSPIELRAQDETSQTRQREAIQRIIKYQNVDKSELENLTGKLLVIDGAEDDADLLLLGELKGVTHLEIVPNYDTFTTAGFAFLAKARDLDTLKIYNSIGSSYPNVDEGILKYLENLPKFREIFLDGIPITERGLASLSKVKSLESIRFPQVAFSSENLRMFQALPDLMRLYIGADPKMYYDLAELAKLSELEELTLCRAKIRGPDLAQLKTLKHLRRLSLLNADIEGRLESLQELRHLSELDLSGSNVSDQDMVALAKHRRLNRLVLNGCNITDKGLNDLVKERTIPNWQWAELQISGTKVTDEGLLRLDDEYYWHMDKLILDYKAISDEAIAKLKTKAHGRMLVEKLCYQKQ